MEFSFIIPRNNKELLEDGDCSHYFVKQIYNANEIQTQLRGELDLNWIHGNPLKMSKSSCFCYL